MRSIIILLLLGFSLLSNAQRIEVNPNIKWSFVQYQDMELQSGRTYSFEFPAEKGYDYIASVTHERTDLTVNIGVFDLQRAEVRQKTDSTGSPGVDLNFRVTDNGTYLIMFSLASDELDALLPSKVAIVRRPIVPQ